MNSASSSCRSSGGRPRGTKYPLPLSRAIRIASGPATGLTIGGVVIAERHSRERSEAARLLAKSLEAAATSSADGLLGAADAAPAARLSARLPRGGIEPRRVVLTFSPCGRKNARLPALARRQGAARGPSALSSAPQPAREIDRDLPRQTCAASIDQPYAAVGCRSAFNVESVSINRATRSTPASISSTPCRGGLAGK